MPPSCLHRGSTNLLTLHRHSAVVTLANVRDKHPVPDLVNGNEQNGYGNRACTCQKHLIGGKAMKAKDFTNARLRTLQGVDDQPSRQKSCNKSRVCARVEHMFCVVKRLRAFSRVRPTHQPTREACDPLPHGSEGSCVNLLLDLSIDVAA